MKRLWIPNFHSISAEWWVHVLDFVDRNDKRTSIFIVQQRSERLSLNARGISKVLTRSIRVLTRRFFFNEATNYEDQQRFSKNWQMAILFQGKFFVIVSTKSITDSVNGITIPFRVITIVGWQWSGLFVKIIVWALDEFSVRLISVATSLPSNPVNFFSISWSKQQDIICIKMTLQSSVRSLINNEKCIGPSTER